MTRSPWWRHAVVYEVYVRSFADGGGDGEGDLRGVRSRLAYLRDLGVDALWLTPFYPSPLADGGYDVADHTGVDPRFGTLDDFDALVADAHAHGLRVIIDIVPNHTSDRHRWFREALAAPIGDPARERYVFRPGRRNPDGRMEGPPNDWPSMFGGSAWERLPDGQWYLHLYAREQPDLNWRDPGVRRAFEDVLRFWLDRGVDGFRIDVAAGLFKDPAFADVGADARTALHGRIYSRPEVHGVYRDWRRILESYDGDRMAVGEVWTDSPDELARFLRPDELHQAFQFDLQLAPWSAPAFRDVIQAAVAAVEPTGAAPTWVLSSHDMPRHVTRYERPPGVPGIGTARARAALLMLLALPGSAYLYQGEELGLPEVEDLPDEVRQDPISRRTGGKRPGRDGCRVPIPWSGAKEPYGFAPDGTRPWLPMPPDWASLTVEAQDGDPASMLSFYRSALALRRELAPSLPEEIEWPDDPSDASVVFRRGRLTCALNCSDNPVRLPPGEVVLASAACYGDLLPGNTSAWLVTDAPS
ncbi:glycoside hydrolase family 13 protein [Actinomadura rupiterrae]|uniref:glycoside hydrolase family 13 protein n=1 Tax=Actinomadura rupiterrae TaxID=559627 RepID=UPI0020A36BAA|nr:alpha-amylase family glycosyl hydrolase [Actinomadura rupiterrae]MCP2341904.1 alpha-glucosidase [Actinomadura rupiterrae]